MHDLASLIKHLHLLLGVVVLGEDVNVGNHVVCQLVSKLLYCRLLVRYDLLILVLELGHGLCAAATCRLVGRYVHGLDVRELLDNIQCYHHLNGCAVGVGDDVARRAERILGIHLGHNQGHILIHAECRRVVDHQRTMLGDGLPILLRC